MKKMYKKLIEEGYSFEYWGRTTLKHVDPNKVAVIDFKEEDLRTILEWKYENYPYINYFTYTVFAKCGEPLHVTLDDFIKYLKSIPGERDDMPELLWDCNDNMFCGGPISIELYTPNWHTSYSNKYFPREPDDLIVFIMETLRDFSFEDSYTLEDFINLVEDYKTNLDVPLNQKKFRPTSLSILMDYVYEGIEDDREADEETIEFYRKSVLELVKCGDYKAIWHLAYDYYEGLHGFPVDFSESLKYLTKAYEMKEDPSVARTIGYIYYYGRTSNGEPIGDKAFQYFAIGHHSGRVLESTYKLADCYMNGYGTPICHKAAYNLVSDIYDYCFQEFLNDNESKMPDVALRLGTYLRDGSGCDKNLEDAYMRLLLARFAIKERIEKDEYIGDRSVAGAIARSVDNMEKHELSPFKGDRTIIEKGYEIDRICVLNDVYGVITPLSKTELSLKVYSDRRDIKNVAAYCDDIGYFEKRNCIEYVLIFDEPHGVRRSYGRGKVEIHPTFVSIKSCGKARELDWSKIILVPGAIKTLENEFLVASVRFEGSEKTYEYLSLNKELNIGDAARLSGSPDKKVIIESLRAVYEDQLPLPLSKMATIE